MGVRLKLLILTALAFASAHLVVHSPTETLYLNSGMDPEQTPQVRIGMATSFALVSGTAMLGALLFPRPVSHRIPATWILVLLGLGYVLLGFWTVTYFLLFLDRHDLRSLSGWELEDDPADWRILAGGGAVIAAFQASFAALAARWRRDRWTVRQLQEEPRP